MKQTSVWALLKPVLVLTAICLAAAGALGLVNNVTAPIIEERQAAEALQRQREFFPDASAFTEIPCSQEGVQSVFAADTGGYVITVSTGGYNGPVPVTVGIDADGVVVGVSPDTSGETAAKGTLAGEPAYLQGFLGLSGTADGVDLIAGATISSRAVRDGVSMALDAYMAIKEG